MKSKLTRGLSSCCVSDLADKVGVWLSCRLAPGCQVGSLSNKYLSRICDVPTALQVRYPSRAVLFQG